MPVSIRKSYLEYTRPLVDRGFRHPITDFVMPLADRKVVIDSRWEVPSLKGFYDNALTSLNEITGAIFRAINLEADENLKPEIGAAKCKEARLATLAPALDSLALACAGEITFRFQRLADFRQELLDATGAAPTESESIEVRAIARTMSMEALRSFVSAAIENQRWGSLIALESGLAPVKEKGTFDQARIDAVLKLFPGVQAVQEDINSLANFALNVARAIFGMGNLAVDRALNHNISHQGVDAMAVQYSMPDIAFKAFARAAPKVKPESTRYEGDQGDPNPRTPKKTAKTPSVVPTARLTAHRQKVFGAPRR